MRLFYKEPRHLSPEEQKDLDDRLIDSAKYGTTEMVQTLLAAGANVHANGDDALRGAAYAGRTETVNLLLAMGGASVHARDDEMLRYAALHGHTEIVKALLAAGADVHAWNDAAFCWAAFDANTETMRVLAKHIFAPDSWRGKSRIEIEAYASALYDKIKVNVPQPERLGIVRTILADSALTCWEQVRPPPPKLTISPIPAQPRPV